MKAVCSESQTGQQAKVDVNNALSPTQWQFAKFAVVGFASNLTLYGYYLLLTIASLKPHAAMTIAYATGMLLTFLLNRNWTFAYLGPGKSAVGRYVLVYVFGYVINFLMLSIMVNHLGYPHEIVQAGLILFLATAFFVVQKFWVFGRRAKQ